MLAPFDQVRSARLAGLTGIIFDIDDTVTRDGRLEAEAFSAMHALADAGLRLIAVTGRPLGWSDVAAHLWPVDLAVGENGAGWAWRVGHALQLGYYQGVSERAEAALLLDRIRSDVMGAMPEVHPAGDQHLRRCDLAFDVGETVHLEVEQIERLVEIIEMAGARSTVSSVHAHAVPGAWDKAKGVTRAAHEALDVDLDADRAGWLFIGDSGNDAAAFAHFPLSVGVRNVEAHLSRSPEAPHYITRRDRGLGFAEMAAAVLSARA